MSGPALSRARVLVGRARLLLLVASLAGAVYLTMRIDVLRVPREGCSPVLRYAPGALLLVDGRPPRVLAGDVVLFAGGEALLIGIVERFGEPDPATGDPPLWIVTDDPDCAGRGSDELGWIPADALRGRVLFALPL